MICARNVSRAVGGIIPPIDVRGSGAFEIAFAMLVDGQIAWKESDRRRSEAGFGVRRGSIGAALSIREIDPVRSTPTRPSRVAAFSDVARALGPDVAPVPVREASVPRSRARGTAEGARPSPTFASDSRNAHENEGSRLTFLPTPAIEATSPFVHAWLVSRPQSLPRAACSYSAECPEHASGREHDAFRPRAADAAEPTLGCSFTIQSSCCMTFILSRNLHPTRGRTPCSRNELLAGTALAHRPAETATSVCKPRVS
jgi:hypothetical protein